MDRYIGLMIDMIIHCAYILAFCSNLSVLTTQSIYNSELHVLCNLHYPRYIQNICSQEYLSLQTNTFIYQSCLVQLNIFLLPSTVNLHWCQLEHWNLF